MLFSQILDDSLSFIPSSILAAIVYYLNYCSSPINDLAASYLCPVQSLLDFDSRITFLYHPSDHVNSQT